MTKNKVPQNKAKRASTMSRNSKLKWKEFANIYLDNGGMASEAYREVYKPKSDRSVHASASALLNSDKVQEYLSARKQELADQVTVDQTFCARKYLQILDLEAFESSEYLSLDQLKKLPRSVRKLIKNVKKSKTTTTHTYNYGRDSKEDHTEMFEITWMDKDKALESLSKHVGFFMKDNINLNKDINKKSFTDALKDLDI